MDLGLSGRTALITGASKGIGYAAAASLAREGCNVHIASRSEDTLAEAAKQIRGASLTASNSRAIDGRCAASLADDQAFAACQRAPGIGECAPQDDCSRSAAREMSVPPRMSTSWKRPSAPACDGRDQGNGATANATGTANCGRIPMIGDRMKATVGDEVLVARRAGTTPATS